MADKIQPASRVTGIFPSLDSKIASNAMASLLNAGFPKQNLSVLGADTDEFRGLTAELSKRHPDTILLLGAALGATLGAIFGWYAFELMPAARYFLSISGLMAAFTGAVAGAYVGMLCGTVLRFDTAQYESNVVSKTKKKGFLISVFVKDTAARINAENILDKCSAEEILVAQAYEEQSRSAA